jgi:broad specificity phosphatase PhoE
MKTLCALVFAFIVGTQLHAADSSTDQKLIIIRHGEATSNTGNFYNTDPNSPKYNPTHLTDKGKKSIQDDAQKLMSQGINDNNISVVIVSPLPRAIETANTLVDAGLFNKNKVVTDKRIIEVQAGQLEGTAMRPEWKDSFSKEYGAESEQQVKQRIRDFYEEIVKKYPNGNIVIISHQIPENALIDIASGQPRKLGLGEVVVIPVRTTSKANSY